MVAGAQVAHVASALSCVEILVSLYFGHARVFPREPSLPERDRIILSKGHAAAALYACLAERGFFPTEMLERFACNGSLLGEHPHFGDVPGVECTSGFLGHGLGIGIGMALAMRMAGSKSSVYVVLSDGECNEGSTWEAALWAPAHGLSSVTAIIDFNGLQACGKSTEITCLEPLAGKWAAFGWEALEVDGHDMCAITDALRAPRGEKPRAIVARTVKGKGVSFMEHNLEWHYRPPSPQDLAKALAELGGASG